MNVTQPLDREPWTIVLAAGEGTRLLPLTRALCGEDLPKQFAVIHGQNSMLQATLLRTSALSGAEQTVVVVSEAREELARRQLQGFGDVDVAVQPRNLGTGPGLLLPLCKIMAKDPDAMVVVVPSDHHVEDAEVFLASIRRAEAVARRDNSVVLLGAVPDGPETQYGWILSDRVRHGDGRRVRGFVEKPSTSVASQLFDVGALWNTFIMVGPARRFWELARAHLPMQSALFEAYRYCLEGPSEQFVLSDIYECMAPADFSRDVLEKAVSLRVVPLSPCGWSDWGTPERVLRSLRGTVGFDVLVERLSA